MALLRSFRSFLEEKSYHWLDLKEMEGKLDERTTVLISGRQRKVCHLNKIYDVTGSVDGGTGWYLVVPGQYNLVLLGI